MATGIGFHIKQDWFLYPLFLMGLIIQLHICEKKTQNQTKAKQKTNHKTAAIIWLTFKTNSMLSVECLSLCNNFDKYFPHK